jgi:TDG/mug DNA glycosylase family protein
VIGKEPWLLLLGSAPSQLSLEKQQYYGNPLNHFWHITGALFGFSASLPYSEKLDHLKAAGVCLWDVCGVFSRPQGSADASISLSSANDINSVLYRHPSIRTVACNGRKSFDLFQKHVSSENLGRIQLVLLPSSSPAYAMRNAVQTKTDVWRKNLSLDSKNCGIEEEDVSE